MFVRQINTTVELQCTMAKKMIILICYNPTVNAIEQGNAFFCGDRKKKIKVHQRSFLTMLLHYSILNQN